MASKKKLRRKIEKLQHKLWDVKRDRDYTIRDLEMYQDIVMEQDIEIEKLKSPRIKVWINGDEVEAVASDE